jgi:ribosomal protein L37AE/L43A
MNECAVAVQSRAENNDPLWTEIVQLGVREHVATDLTRKYARELLQFACREVSRKSAHLASPPAFFVWWLSSGLARWHYERTVAREEALERKRNEPLAPYHRKWREMKEELGWSAQPADPDEWRKGLEHLRKVLGITDEPETEQVCPQCGRTMKKPTSSGVCLRCVEAQLTASLKGRQSNKEVLSDAEGTTP